MHSFGWIAALVLILTSSPAPAQPNVLDAFESADGWKVITAEGVTLSLHPDEGIRGHSLRLDYEFVTGAGYCIIQKAFNLKLPENYEFTFQLKGEGPANNLELKLLDAAGDNVWWHNRRALDWPRRWTRMVDKKRSIEFAWGPSNAPLTEAAKIEFAISSSSGGKGSVWLDELTFRELPPESHEPLKPTATASSQAGPEFAPSRVLDDKARTTWKSAPLKENEAATLTLDFERIAEFGGLEIDWGLPLRELRIEASDDANTWTALGEPRHPRFNSTIIPTPDAEARYVRLSMLPRPDRTDVSISAVRVKPPEFSASPNAFIAALAADDPRGRFPRAFHNEQSYWTVIGVDGDDAEALMNEEGAVELGKRGPTLEPFISFDGQLLTWRDGEHTPSLEQGCLPVPTVTRRDNLGRLALSVTAFADGPPGKSWLAVTYTLKNTGDAQARGTLHIALRPFQVNPPWQKLNNEGGFAKIPRIDPENVDGHAALFVGDTFVLAQDPHAHAGTASFDCNDVVEWLLCERALLQQPVIDEDGLASGAISFPFEVNPGQEAQFTIEHPMHPLPRSEATGTDGDIAARRAACIKGWEEKLSRATITVPKQDQWISNTFKSQIAYILINRDGPAIQPGSRSYERSWARDGSMTSAALLACGHADEVRRWIDWFGDHQFESGKIPCVVDSRGPDPVPEHDSHGEYIWAVANYYRYTHDQDFLKAHWPRVQKAVAYIKSLRAQRMTDEYKADGPNHAFYGLVPESISHEGYSAKPMHSYWDDFFVLLGLKEAAYLAQQAKDGSAEAEYAALAQDFRTCLYNSIRAAMGAKQIPYIPGCVELGDFDSTSTTIALWPCDELDHLPQPALKGTFDRYWEFFKARSTPLAAWDAYTPYEIRHVGAFVRLRQPQRAYEALDWFHQHQRPQAWNHWAEVVWHDPLTPKFIGDMPHTWVGSDFLNSVISMFVYEHGDELVTFAGIPRQWIASGEEVGFHNIVTPRGKLSGSLQLTDKRIHIKLWSDGEFAKGDIIIRAPQGSQAQDAQTQTLPAQFSFDYAP